MFNINNTHLGTYISTQSTNFSNDILDYNIFKTPFYLLCISYNHEILIEMLILKKSKQT